MKGPFEPPTAQAFRLIRPVAAVLSLLAGACGPIVEQAPFSYRGDTMSPGDLLGPFEGIVVDAETDRPIAGAVVSGSWAFERGVGLVGPAGAEEVATQTGADGRYRLPRLEALPEGPSMRIRRFTLVVYRRGFVGWRSDRRFPEGTVRRDFSQRGNRVRLERWRDGLTYHQHVRFLGGGAAVKSALGPELEAAALELSGEDPTPVLAEREAAVRSTAVLDIAPLLSDDDIRSVTGYAGAFLTSDLKDLPTTEFYDSLHFKAEGQEESFDVGLRVWKLGEDGAEAQYRKLLGELPGAKPRDEIGDASLRARTGDIYGLAFILRQRGIVVSLTCGVRQCTEESMVQKLAKLVESRLPELEEEKPPAAPVTPLGTPAPDPATLQPAETPAESGETPPTPEPEATP